MMLKLGERLRLARSLVRLQSNVEQLGNRTESADWLAWRGIDDDAARAAVGIFRQMVAEAFPPELDATITRTRICAALWGLADSAITLAVLLGSELLPDCTIAAPSIPPPNQSPITGDN